MDSKCLKTILFCFHSASLGEQYIGCYKDDYYDRALTHAAHSEPNDYQTLEICTKACADADFSYAGAQVLCRH